MLFFILAVINSLLRIYSFICFLPVEDEVEKDNHFTYAYQIHLLNLFHSICLVLFGVMFSKMSAKVYLIFDKKYYNRIMNGIIATALLYLLPLLGIVGLSWYHGEENESDIA